MPLAANDLVLICINAMPNLLGRMPVDSLLTNGKIEKQLKFFLAAAWEHANPAARAYVMDKRPFNGFELDLLAFEDGRPKFWIEAKSRTIGMTCKRPRRRLLDKPRTESCPLLYRSAIVMAILFIFSRLCRGQGRVCFHHS